MISAVLGAVLFFFGIQFATQQTPIEPRVLLPSAPYVLGVPPFSFWSNPECDKDGNIYFHVGGFSGIEILKLSDDGSKGKTFAASDQFPNASKAVFSDFSVTPGGTVYVLAGIEGKTKILRFDEDGAMSEPISLDIPESVIGTNIVASDSGTALFFGYHDETAPPGLRGKSYLALLDLSKKVYQELHESVPGVDMAKLASGQASAPGAALGEDGNFYFAGAKEVLVISQGGELVRRIPFDNPDPQSSATRVHVSGGLLVIVLTRVDDHQVHKSYLVLLAASGGVVGFYKPSEQLGGLGDMCFSAKRGLTFMRLEKRQFELLAAPLQ